MADILIRGMEIPQQGLKVVAIHSNGHVYADTSDPGFLNKIADVIELPEHGDLIDKQAVFKALSEKFKSSDGFVSWTDAIDIVLRAQEVVPSNKEETE